MVFQISFSLTACTILLLFICQSLASLDSRVLKVPETIRNIETFIAILISDYSLKNFRFVFHTNHIKNTNETPEEFIDYELILPNIFLPNVEVERLVINHSDHNRTLVRFRPIGLYFINIAFINQPSTFRAFFEVKDNVRAHDKAVFVLSKSLLMKEDSARGNAFWRKQDKLARFANVIFIVPSATGVEIYDTCYFCGSNVGILRLIGIWNSATGTKKIGIDIFPDQFADFNGHEFRVIFVPYPPLIWCNSLTVLPKSGSNVTENVCMGDLAGPEGNIFNAIRRSLNFTSRIVDFQSTLESQMGTDANTGIWDILINQMSESVGDIALGSISLTLSRNLQVPFTQIFNREPHNFVYMHFDGSPMGVTGPFSPSLWLCLALAWLLTSLLLCAFGTSYRFLLFSGGLWATGAMLLGQGSATPSQFLQSRSSRLILLCWCWFSFILITLYGSKLVSSLINPALPDNPSSLEDLLVKKYEIITAKSSIFAVRDLLNSSDPVYRTLGKKMKVFETLEMCVELLVKSLKGGLRVVVVEENSVLRWGIDSRLPEGSAEDASLRLRMGSAEILASGHAWAIRPNGIAYIPSLNKALRAVVASGLPRYWIDRTLHNGNDPVPYGSTAGNQQIRSASALPLQLFFVSLSIWAGGLIISLILFGIEMSVALTK